MNIQGRVVRFVLFPFSFQPRTIAKEARYEISLTASKNGLSQAANPTVTQKP